MFDGNSSLVIGGSQPTTGRVGGISLGGFVGPSFDPNGGSLAGLFESGFFDNVLSGIIRDNIASGTLGQDWADYQANNPGIVNTSPVIGDNGQQIGSINQDLINDALKNLPQFGDYPVTQTGPTNGPQAPTQAPTQQAEQPPANPSFIPDESGTGDPPSVGDLIGDGPIVGDGSGQVPDAPTNSNTGGNNNDTIPPWLKVILEGGNVSQTPTGADNEGQFPPGVIEEFPNSGGNNSLLNIIFGLFGKAAESYSANSQSANVNDNTANGGAGGQGGAGGSVGDNENTVKDLLTNVGNTLINTGVSNYAADKQLEGNKDAIAFQQGIFDDQDKNLEPFRKIGLDKKADAIREADTNPEYRDLFEGQQKIDPLTDVKRAFVGQDLSAGDRQLDSLTPRATYNAPVIPGAGEYHTLSTNRANEYGGPEYGQPSQLPSIQAGNRDVSSITDNVSYADPRRVNTQGLPSLQAGNRDLGPLRQNLQLNAPQAGNRDVNLGNASQVGVNQINPLDRNDPYLRFLQDEQADVVESSRAAQGKLRSGGTLEALQDRAANVASNYMGQIQNISSAQDQARLASQGQQFGQQTTNAGLTNQFNQQDFGNSLASGQFSQGAQGQQFSQDLQGAGFRNNLNQQDLANASGVRAQQFNEGNQLFNQDVTAAGLQLGAQGQEFGQDLARAGFNNSLNQQDFGNASQARSQLFGEGNTRFDQGMNLAGLDLGAQAQSFAQGIQNNQFTNNLNQQDLTNSLGINSQLFDQDLRASGFDLGQAQNNIQNQLALNQQNYGQNFDANRFSLNDDQNRFNQLFDLTRLGQNSAANQGAGAASLMESGGQLLSTNGQIKAANVGQQANNIGNFLAGLFS